MNYHCESCDGTSMVRDEDGNFESCPGCHACAEKDAKIADLERVIFIAKFKDNDQQKALQVADEMAFRLQGCDAFHRTDKDDATISELLQRYREARARSHA